MPPDRPKAPSHRKTIAFGSLFAFVLIIVAGRLTPSVTPQTEGESTLEEDQVVYTTVAQMRSAAPWNDRVRPTARLVRFEPGTATPRHSHGDSYLGLLISGVMRNPFAVEEGPTLGPGTYWYVPSKTEHVTACVSKSPCLAYLRSAQQAGPE